MKEKKFDISKLKRITKENCFVCKKEINNEFIIYEDREFIAFLDSYPPTKGYTIIFPKRHIEDITELTKKEYIKLQKLVFKISNAVKKAFNPKRICIVNTGGLLTHFHFHIVPMYKDIYNNFFKIFGKEKILELSNQEKQDIAQKIKENL